MVIEITFDAKLQMMGPEEFVRDVLHQALDVRHLFAGADFAFERAFRHDGAFKGIWPTFGHGGRGAIACPCEGADIITSTAIRTALRTPDLELAAALLSRVLSCPA